jgi:hypothetical protein
MLGRRREIAVFPADDDASRAWAGGRFGDRPEPSGGVGVEPSAEGVVDVVGGDVAEEARTGVGGQHGQATAFEPNGDLSPLVVAEKFAADAPFRLGELPDVAGRGARHEDRSGLAWARSIDDLLT